MIGNRILLVAGIMAFAAASGVIHLISAEAEDLSRLESGLIPGAAPCSAGRFPEEAAFLTENGTAMDTMMAGMNVRPTGDVDGDFAGLCCKVPLASRDTPARGAVGPHRVWSRSPTSWTASVSAHAPRPKARSTRCASPRMSRVRLKVAA